DLVTNPSRIPEVAQDFKDGLSESVKKVLIGVLGPDKPGQIMSRLERIESAFEGLTELAPLALGGKGVLERPGRVGAGASSASPEAQPKVAPVDDGSRGGKYGHLEDGPTVGPDKDFTAAQKRRILKENQDNGDGVIRDDRSGEELVRP